MAVLVPPDTQFARLAESVADKVAGLLRSAVVVVDDQGSVAASRHGALARLSPEQRDTWEELTYLRVPLVLGDRAGEVLVGDPQGEEAVSPRLAQALVEMIINETAVLDRLPNQHEIKNRFIHDLLHGRIEDEDEILRQARFLGMDLAPPRAVILIDATDYFFPQGVAGRHDGAADGPQVQRQAQFLISSVVNFFYLPNDTICAYVGDGEVAVLKASNTKNLLTWAENRDASEDTNTSWANLAALKRAGNALLGRLRNDTHSSMSIGIGRYHPGIRGLVYSYRDAQAALSLGRRFHGHNRVHCLDELGIPGFVGVSDEQTKIDLAVHLLSPLDHEPELLTTLDAFFAHNCSPSATVAEMSIHRNTLSYRLDKITSLTGLNPRRFDDAVQVRLALMLRALRTGSAQFT